MIDINNVSAEFLRTIDISDLLPQRPPFVMVDALKQIDARLTTTEMLVAADNIFVDDGCLSASGLIENIAQSCAARIGFIDKYVREKDIQVGVIGAIRNLQVFTLPHVGKTITTVITAEEEIFGMTLASARVECDGQVLVTATMKIALRNETKE